MNNKDMIKREDVARYLITEMKSKVKSQYMGSYDELANKAMFNAYANVYKFMTGYDCLWRINENKVDIVVVINEDGEIIIQ